MTGEIWSQNERAAVIHQALNLGMRCGKVAVPGRTSRAVYHQIQILRKQNLLPKSPDRHYRSEEERLLVTLIRQGRKLKEIRLPGRSPQSIYGHIKLLRRKGFQQLTLKHLWMPSEDSQLLSQVTARGRSPKQVVIAGRSRKSIYNRIKALRRDGKITRYFRKLTPARRWDRREIAEVLQASAQNGQHRGAVSLKKAGLFPERTVAALSRMISLCGLADPKKSRAVRTRLKLTPEQKEEFRRWLKTEGRNLPTALAAKRFGFREDFVTHFRQCHALQVNHREALNHPVYRAWHEAQVSKRIQSRMAVYRKNREDRLRHMTDLNAVLKSLRSKERRRACRACCKSWFATRDFFRLRSYHKNGQQRFSFDYLCWACPATNRAKIQRTSAHTNSFSQPGGDRDR
jgi:hypothetical protein